MRQLALGLLGMGTCLGLACSSETTEPTPAVTEPGQIVPSGKEDNFLSSTAQEYVVEGVSTVTIENNLATATPEKKLERVHQLIALKHVVIGWFLNEYISNKEDEEANATYGGLGALTKNGSYEQMNIEAVDDKTYRFTFRQTIGGKVDLLNRLTTRTDEQGRRVFDVAVGKVSNYEMEQLQSGREWYKKTPWNTFDPNRVDPSRWEKLTMSVWPEKRSNDAYFDYNALFADGKVSVGVHFGWDYHSQYHLSHSRDIYNWLINTERFRSPVGSFEEYKRTSGPLTKTIDANGKPVQVEVSLFWGQPGTDTDPSTDAGGKMLEKDMLESFASREVIIYAGHAGPFYGFAMASWHDTKEGDIDDTEVVKMSMPKDLYQVVVAEGCNTYSLGQSFRMNPNKPNGANIDVITSTNFADAGSTAGVRDSLQALFGSDVQGRMKPITFMSYLRLMDTNNVYLKTMYGAHGIDDNPHRHPFANEEKLCKSCTDDASCGGLGNACTKLNDNEKFCTFACTADDGCPEGFACMAVATSGTMSERRCAPKNLTCVEPPPEEPPPQVLISEIFASPGEQEDVNEDGSAVPWQDEFVELMNISQQPVDLSAWTIADATMTRMAFEDGLVLAPGELVVVFGGGDVVRFNENSEAQAIASAHELGLDALGDRVTLSDPRGNVVDEVLYGPEAGEGASIERKTADKDSEWFVNWTTHTAGTWSPPASEM